MQLVGTVALVTGASKGLGRALATALAFEGASVILVARNQGPLQEVVDEIRGSGGQAWGIAADVADEDAAARLIGEATALAGPVDILINNASTLGAVPMPQLLDTDPSVFARTFAVNVLGPFRLMRAVVGSMAVRGGGVVVNISSDAAVEAYAGWGAYSASKAALDHLTRVWAAELDGSGVRLLAIDPGEMDTAMHADAIPDADPTTLADPADVATRIVDRIRTTPNGTRIAA